jgi:hypothetical protein
MRGVQHQLNDASGEISEHLSGMAATASELKKLADSLEGTHLVLGTIQGDLGGLRAQQTEVKEAIAGMRLAALKPAPLEGPPRLAGSETTQKEFVKAALGQMSLNGFLLIVALDCLAKSNNGQADVWVDFVDEHFKNPLASLLTENLAGFKYTVIGLEVMMIFRSFGLVDWTHPKGRDGPLGFKLKPDFFDLVALTANKSVSNMQSQARVNAIRASFQNESSDATMESGSKSG